MGGSLNFDRFNLHHPPYMAGLQLGMNSRHAAHESVTSTTRLLRPPETRGVRTKRNTFQLKPSYPFFTVAQIYKLFGGVSCVPFSTKSNETLGRTIHQTISALVH
ncbi:hypothetical protein TNCV_3291671 [Trichonephila clavipes]|nr:hypothetical protein TNCV_3291671 [Trichonephila clavipes]